MSRKNLMAFLQAYLKARATGTIRTMNVDFLKSEFQPGFTSFMPRPYVDEYGRHGVAVEATYQVEKPKMYAPKTRVECMYFRPIGGLMMLCSPGHPTLG